MTKLAKTVIAVILALLLVGVCLIAVATVNGGSFNRAAFEERREYTAEGDFSSINIELADTDIDICESSDGTCKLVCYESDKTTYTLTVESGALRITENDLREWYDCIGITYGMPRATLYIPVGDYESLALESGSSDLHLDTKGSSYGTVSIKTASGEISIAAKGVGDMSAESASGSIGITADSAKELRVMSASGDVSIKACGANAVSVSASSGNIVLGNVLVSGRIDIDVASGDVKLEHCDGGSIDVSSSSGNVDMTLLTPKVFDISTSSGDTDCPSSVAGAGACRVSTSSGDVRISLAP